MAHCGRICSVALALAAVTAAVASAAVAGPPGCGDNDPLAQQTTSATFAPAGSQVAQGACGDLPLEQPFLQFGDDDTYTLVPEGTFESGRGWILTGGARIVAGNEPFYAHGQGERRSLFLVPGATATSRPVCLALALPTLRFFTRASPGGILKVEVVFMDAAKRRRIVEFSRFGAPASWWATPPLLFLVNAAVPVRQEGTMVVSFRFTALSGAWQIDDVYVDPRVGRL